MAEQKNATQTANQLYIKQVFFGIF